MIANETVLVRSLSETPERIEVITRSKITDGQACVTAQGVSLGNSSLDNDAADFVLSFTKDAIADYGGVCGTYYSAGENFVVTSIGGDGRAFPPGDTSFRFVPGALKLRVQ